MVLLLINIMAITLMVIVSIFPAQAENYVSASKRLIPKPVEVENLDTVFELSQANWYLGKATDRFPLDEYLKELKIAGVSQEGQKNAYFGTVNDLGEVEACKEALKNVPEDEEGYYLEVTNDKLVVIGRSDAGAFYGIQTLRQLTEDDKLVAVGARIIDYPALRYRAITDDISRGPLTKLEFMKQIIKTMSSFKLNIYSPYMELQVLEGIRLPEETISTNDYEELIAFSKKYHVDVVPSLQTFGHCTVFLALPDYKHLGNLSSGSSQLDPTNPKVYEFLEQEISKLASLTKAPFINIGGDETWELASGNSGIEVSRIGACNVYLEHILKVMEIVKKNGKIPMFWGDMVLAHPELIAKLPEDVIVLNWHYGDATSMPQRLAPFQAEGKRQWAAPGIDNWLRIFPFYLSSNNNVNSFAKIGTKHGIEGLFTTTWDDDGDTLFGNNWYGVVFASEAAWKGGGPGTSFFNNRFDLAVFGQDYDIQDAIMKLAYTNYYTYQGYFKNSNLLFFKDPFADLEIYNMASNGSQLVLTEEQVLKTLAKADVKRNQHFLSTLSFTAWKVGTFGRKLLVTKKVIDTVTEIEGTPETEKLYELAQDLYALEKEIRELYNEFSTLYLKENKSSFLNELKQRYLSLRSCLFAKAMELENASYQEYVQSPEMLGLPRSPKKKK